MKLIEIKEKYPDFNIYELEKMPLKQLIWTSIGVYGDQSIEEIFEEKIEDIKALNETYKDGGYCLWALNRFNSEKFRDFCYSRENADEPIYVLMKYTESSNAKDGEMFTSEHFDETDIQSITAKYPDDICKLHIGDNHSFPKALPHKETIKPSNLSTGRAFIIDEFGILDSTFVDHKDFLSHYINKQSNKNAIKSIVGQNDSGLLAQKKEFDIKNIAQKLNDTDDVKFYVARLKAPYFVEIKLEELHSSTPDRNRR